MDAEVLLIQTKRTDLQGNKCKGSYAYVMYSGKKNGNPISNCLISLFSENSLMLLPELCMMVQRTILAM